MVGMAQEFLLIVRLGLWRTGDRRGERRAKRVPFTLPPENKIRGSRFPLQLPWILGDGIRSSLAKPGAESRSADHGEVAQAYVSPGLRLTGRQ